MNNKEKITAAAQAAHEVNRVYCLSHGDTSQPHWEDAPEWQKTSAINGVQGVLAGNTPEQSHESWLKEKLENGWVYGSVKDPEKKTHPCIVAYAALPLYQQNKDHIYVRTVKVMLEAFGLL